MNQRPLRLGIIGAGIFVRDAHLPAFLRLPHFYQVVAMCSKRGDSARTLAQRVPNLVTIYTDPSDLLTDTELDVVDIVLPIDVMLPVVEQALLRGKHVISEKPIASNSVEGRQLLGCYAETRRRFTGQQWMVAENWRYEDAFQLVAKLVGEGEIGRPLTFHWAQHVAMNITNKYFVSPWRRAGHIAGGFLLDVGVHHMAALRLIFGEFEGVTAQIEQFSPELPPVDTLAATMRMKNGVLGSYLLSFAAGASWQPLLHIVGEKGSIRTQRGFVEVTNEAGKREIPCAGMNGVENELAAFAAALLDNLPHRNPPEEALVDLAMVEMLLQAAENEN